VCSLSLAPLPASIAGGAGARPHHLCQPLAISGHTIPGIDGKRPISGPDHQRGAGRQARSSRRPAVRQFPAIAIKKNPKLSMRLGVLSRPQLRLSGLGGRGVGGWGAARLAYWMVSNSASCKCNAITRYVTPMLRDADRSRDRYFIYSNFLLTHFDAAKRKHLLELQACSYN